MKAAEILDLPMGENDADATTVRRYLKELLMTLWIEEESFSGKRPFGNSGWQSELYWPLVKAGLIKGEIDSEGYLQDYDTEAGNGLIQSAIEALN